MEQNSKINVPKWLQNELYEKTKPFVEKMIAAYKDVGWNWFALHTMAEQVACIGYYHANPNPPEEKQASQNSKHTPGELWVKASKILPDDETEKCFRRKIGNTYQYIQTEDFFPQHLKFNGEEIEYSELEWLDESAYNPALLEENKQLKDDLAKAMEIAYQENLKHKQLKEINRELLEALEGVFYSYWQEYADPKKAIEKFAAKNPESATAFALAAIKKASKHINL